MYLSSKSKILVNLYNLDEEILDQRMKNIERQVFTFPGQITIRRRVSVSYKA